MIWFGNVNRLVVRPPPELIGFDGEAARMRMALERVAESTPGLWGGALLDALAATGWVDRATAERLLPCFRTFDADAHFAEYMRRLSFRGRSAAEEFRAGIRLVVGEIMGAATVDQVGPEECIRFGSEPLQGIVLAQPEVAFTIAGRTRDAIAAAVEEMPDALVVVARNFDRGASDQLRAVLDRSGVPGTLVTVNQLLGIRATALRYQPRIERVLEVLAVGGMMRSADIARLGERAA